MELFGLLAIVVILILLIPVIFLDQHERNYWRRGIIPLLSCPFSDRKYSFSEIKTQGTRRDREGLLSYSLYGNYSKYLPTLTKSLEVISKILPSWQARIYVSITIPDEVIDSLINLGAEVIVMGPSSPLGHEGALWRFLPLEKDLPFLCLDADDLFNSQMVEYIKDWLQSTSTFCNLSPIVFFIPMTANLWGARGRAIPNIRDRLGQYCETFYGFDEAFLKKEVWPVSQVKGCYFITSLRLDKGVIGYAIIVLVLIVYLLWRVYCSGIKL